jgi:hypothetical protein
MGNKISSYSENTNPATGNFVLGETASGPTTNRFKFLNLISLFGANLGAWHDWTPTYANLTVGSGTVVARYMQIGKTVIVKFKFTFGSGSSINTTPTVSFPVTAASDVFGEMFLGLAMFVHIGSADFTGLAVCDSSSPTSDFAFRDIATIGGSNPVNIVGNSGQQITSNAPFTWAIGDILYTSFTYEAA